MNATVEFLRDLLGVLAVTCFVLRIVGHAVVAVWRET